MGRIPYKDARMAETPNLLEQRIRQCEEALGIAGITSPATASLHCAYPINSLYISKDNASPTFGTWELLNSGNLLGGTVSTVYVFKRTA